MKESKKLGVAIVGAFGVAYAHAKAYRRVPELEVKVVCDLDREVGEKLARFSECDFESDLDKVLARDDVHIVDIVTPDETHANIAIKAAKAGKHLLIEKPVATSLEDFDRIAAEVERAGVHAMGIQCYRWAPPLRRMVELVKKGTIGQPVFVRIASPSSPFHRPDQPIWQKRPKHWLLVRNGCHQVDMLCWMLDCFPTKVHAISHPGQDWLPPHEYFSLLLTFENGTIALSEENRIMQPQGYPFHQEFYVVGTEGTLDLSDRQHPSASLFNKEGFTPLGHNDFAPEDDHFTGQIRDFAELVLGRGPATIPLSFTRKVLSTVFDGVNSMYSGKEVICERKS